MGECSICALPEVAAMVDDLLDQGVYLEVISTQLAQLNPPVRIHKSSIHRHKAAHYLPRLRLRMAEKKASRTETRIFVQWPEHSLLGELAGKITSDADAIAPCQLRERDILLTVTFEEGGQKAAQGSPTTLKPEEGEQTMPEEKKADGLFTKLRRLFAQDKPAEPPAAPVVEPPPETLQEIQAKCQHDFKPVANSQRCLHCGLQKNPPAFGVSRAQFFEGLGRRRRF